MERIEVAIAERNREDARSVKEEKQALAAKSGFTMAELFGAVKGKRGLAQV